MIRRWLNVVVVVPSAEKFRGGRLGRSFFVAGRASTIVVGHDAGRGNRGIFAVPLSTTAGGHVPLRATRTRVALVLTRRRRRGLFVVEVAAAVVVMLVMMTVVRGVRRRRARSMTCARGDS